jgi:hypothetical protein
MPSIAVKAFHRLSHITTESEFNPIVAAANTPVLDARVSALLRRYHMPQPPAGQAFTLAAVDAALKGENFQTRMVAKSLLKEVGLLN